MMNGKDIFDREFIAAVLTRQGNDLLKELNALQSRCCSKVIHDTRVQSRRIRSALEAFCDLFNADAYKALYRDIRKITKLLGPPRETGVALELLQGLSNEGDLAEGICWEYLAERMEMRLRKQMIRLRRNLREIDTHQLQLRIQSLLGGFTFPSAIQIQQKGLDRGVRKPAQSPLFPKANYDCEYPLRIFRDLAEPILSFRPRYQFSRATDAHLHKMRINAKKLRYAMELFASVWPHGLKDECAAAHALQDADGKYHDWCSLCDGLRKEIRHSHKRDAGHLAFQIGRLLAFADDRRHELRKPILPAITSLQSMLLPLLQEANDESDSSPKPMAAAQSPGNASANKHEYFKVPVKP